MADSAVSSHGYFGEGTLIPNAYPPSGDPETANKRSKENRKPQRSKTPLRAGLVLYLLRMVLVVGYALIGAPEIGGPNVDAGSMVWIPFFLADLPWSIFFDTFDYQSNTAALIVYAGIVGLPWIVYGYAVIRLADWLARD